MSIKKIPIGISDFKELRENNYYYVDKTLLIQEVYKPAQVILITRPRRFGKTLNLSMMRYFFELTTQSNAHLFEDTALWKNPEFRSLQGNFPVIFISFKNIKETKWEETYHKFAFMIYEEYSRHRYLLSDGSLAKDEKALFNLFWSEKHRELSLKTVFNFLQLSFISIIKKKLLCSLTNTIFLFNQLSCMHFIMMLLNF